ncbi:MAG: hypothetical protein JST93_36630 [Acidobacteria bacterium]|nr:hypothetical protein [Acidobacteriota bacterium]
MTNRLLVMLLLIGSSWLPGQSLSSFMPATEYIRGGGRLVATLKNSERVFTDVTLNDSYYGPAHLMLDPGITSGCGGTSFCPFDAVNRGAVAVFVIRSL